MKKVKISFIFLIILISFGCKNAPKQYLVFDYEDFGPQAMAYQTFGMQWWQWDSHGDSNPNTKYDIKIIVYHKTFSPKSFYYHT